MKKMRNNKKMHNQLLSRMLQSSISSCKYELEEYVDTISSLMKVAEKKAIQWVQKQQKKYPNIDISDLDVEEIIKLQNDFPNIHRTSTCITIFSAYENELKYICSAIENRIQCGIVINNWRSNILNKAANFLKNNAKINFDSLEESWEKAHIFRIMRNAIVHNSSYLDLNELENPKDSSDKESILTQKAIEYSEQNDLINKEELRLRGNYKIQLNDKFLLEMVTLFDLIMSDIIQKFFKQQ